MNFKDKKIIITGSTGGIGGDIVKAFTNHGCKIIATGTNEEKLSKIKEKYGSVITKKLNYKITVP